MSEKRFKKGMNLSCVDTKTGKFYWYACNLCGLLNNLVEENNKLDKDNLDLILTNFKQIKERLKLMNENEQLKQENEQLRLELETHKHPLWSTREAERKLSEVTDNLANEIKKNGLLNEEINQLRIENMRLKKRW